MTFFLTDAQRTLQSRARAFAAATVAPRAAETDRLERYPTDSVAGMTRAGFMGLTIPRDLGGPGGGLLDACLVIEEMAAVCGTTGRIAVEANMGALGAVLRHGARKRAQRYGCRI